MAHVAIFGGGVAGLTAALELVHRDFEVTVYEARHWGGKIRSMGKPGTGTGGRSDLPGEHGFHFFPTFYRHIPDTMAKIPRPAGTGSVLDNLVEGSRELIASTAGPPVEMPSCLPSSLRDWSAFVRALRNAAAGISPGELAFFAERTLMFMSACDQRRITEYDQISWWDFLRADRMSYAFQQLMIRLPPLLLVAVHPRKASARTLGHAFMDMLRAGFLPGNNIERSLNGPPSDMWVDPWVAHLSTRARMILGGELVGLDVNPHTRRISAARVKMHAGASAEVRQVHADYYVCALPVEAMVRVLSEPVRRAAPSLSNLDRLPVAWMNGLQLFLDRPFPVTHGHVAYEDSAWAISSVSQAQFWSGVDMTSYGDGRLGDVFSVILSDWDTPGTEVVFKPARACTAEELLEESLAQIQDALRRSGLAPLRREYILDWMLDPSITYPWSPNDMPPLARAAQEVPDGPPGTRRSRLVDAGDFAQLQQQGMAAGGITHNAEPLFITTVGIWKLRPEPATEIGNLFLASDYVKTTADFASAEGADEAARKAVNCILDAAGARAPRVRTWQREEPLALAPLRALDAHRFGQGRPQLDLPAWLRSLVPQ